MRLHAVLHLSVMARLRPHQLRSLRSDWQRLSIESSWLTLPSSAISPLEVIFISESSAVLRPDAPGIVCERRGCMFLQRGGVKWRGKPGSPLVAHGSHANGRHARLRLKCSRAPKYLHQHFAIGTIKCEMQFASASNTRLHESMHMQLLVESDSYARVRQTHLADRQREACESFHQISLGSFQLFRRRCSDGSVGRTPQLPCWSDRLHILDTVRQATCRRGASALNQRRRTGCSA